MDAKKQAMLDKVAKMVNLSIDQKGTPEGDQARAMAVSLMAKYQIEETDLMFANVDTSEVFQDTDGLEILLDERGVKPWVQFTASVIATTFHCKVYLHSRRGTVHFIGSEADLETASYFMMMIHNHVEARSYEEYPNSYIKRRVFGLGAYDTIERRLSEMRKAMEKATKQAYSGGTDLMVVKDSLVEAEWDKFIAQSKVKKAKKTKITVSDRNAYEKGMAAGKSAPMNKGIKE